MDKVTDAERAMIDAAIAAGHVTRIGTAITEPGGRPKPVYDWTRPPVDPPADRSGSGAWRDRARRSISVEGLLIWAYRDQRVAHAVDTARLGAAGYGRTSIARVAEVGALGCVVRGGGGDEVRVDDDAYAVLNAVRSMTSPDERRIVEVNAALGSRPDVVEASLVPVLGSRGRPRVDQVDERGEPSAAPTARRWCPLRLTAKPGEVARAVEARRIWFDVVGRLAKAIEDGRLVLSRHEIGPVTVWLNLGD